MVFLAENIYTQVAVAVKMEHVNASHPQLKYESKIYERLGNTNQGFIEVYYYGSYNKMWNALCMELLGPDLDDLYGKSSIPFLLKLPLSSSPGACNRHFSLKTVLMIGIQVLHIIRVIHSKNIIYRDIKPENFCIGHHYQQKEKHIHIVDFGLSKMYEECAKIQLEDEFDYLVGTAR